MESRLSEHSLSFLLSFFLYYRSEKHGYKANCTGDF